MSSPITSIKNFIREHKTLCESTLGLAIVGFTLYVLGKKVVAWIKEPAAVAKKVHEKANTLHEVAVPDSKSAPKKEIKPILKQPNSPRKHRQVRWKENLESVRQISAIIRA